MTKPEDETQKPGEGDGTGDKAVDVDKLKEQITNLTTAVGQMREASKNSVSKADYDKLASELEALKKKPEDENLDLSTEDQKKLDAWLASKGVVTQAEIEAQKAEIAAESQKQIETQAVTEFLEKYPDFNKDEEWAKVIEQFNLYRTPTTLQGFRTILGKIHSELTKGEGDAKTKAKIEAEKETKGRLSLGGKTQTGPNEGLELEDLQKKYPNLSIEQIKQRKAELDALYPEKKE